MDKRLRVFKLNQDATSIKYQIKTGNNIMYVAAFMSI